MATGLSRKAWVALLVVGCLILGGGWLCPYIFNALDNLPGERPRVALQSYPSPSRTYVARIQFKVMRSDNYVDNYDTWVEVCPASKMRGVSVVRLFRTTCLACVWKDDRDLIIYYWGAINKDYKIVKEVDGIKIRLFKIDAPGNPDPSMINWGR